MCKAASPGISSFAARPPLAFALAMLLLVGCDRNARDRGGDTISPEDYGRLPGARASSDPQLREELARVEEERGLPEQLASASVPAEENAAVVLYDIFPPDKVGALLHDSAALLPPRGFDFDPIRLEKARAFRAAHEAERLKAREALKRPRCNLGIPYTRGYTDLPIIDILRVCARLEALLAAEQLAESKLDAAIDSLDAMLRYAALLAAEKTSITRLEAAYLRAEALRVAARLATHEKTSAAQLERLLSVVEQQLQTWPADSDAWIGDRALGMHAYEIVRAGRVLALLTPDEISQFEKEKSLVELTAATQRIADADECFYLESMRRIIESCKKPYYQRRALFESIHQELEALRPTDRYPLVAARLLLPNVRAGHEVQARDRANWEAFAAATRMALGHAEGGYRTNPLTGEPYHVTRENGLVIVDRLAPDEPADAVSLVVGVPRQE